MDEKRGRADARFVASGHFSSHLSTDSAHASTAAVLPGRCASSTECAAVPDTLNLRERGSGGNLQRRRANGNSRSLIRAPDSYLVLSTIRACDLLSTMSACGDASSTRCTPQHAAPRKWPTDGYHARGGLRADVTLQLLF